jgi:hypothetical protein
LQALLPFAPQAKSLGVLATSGERALEAIERQAARILDLTEELRRVNPKE